MKCNDSKIMGGNDTSVDGIDFPTVFEAIDIPALMLDDEGDVIVWNESLGDLLNVYREDIENVENIGEAIYEDRQYILAEKVLNRPENADEMYDIEVADSEYALLSSDGHPTYEDTSTATAGSGADIWFLATPLYVDDDFVGVIEFVQKRADSERRRREMERLIDELQETLSAFQEGDYTARAEYDFAESVVEPEDREFLEQVNDLARMREALREQVNETTRTKRKLERRNEQLQRQNERLDQFASMISHDLRNPLSIAMMYLEAAEDTGDPDDFEAVRDALDRMETMIEDMLLLARSGETIESTETHPLEDIVREGWENVQTEEVTLDVRIGDCTVDADRTRLLHVFENLFRNAVDHNEPPLTVRVGLLESVEGFYVEDTGEGIPESDCEDVFDHGYSTSENGNGLGLALVDHIVEAHGWTIRTTESNEGGARFEIRTDTERE